MRFCNISNRPWLNLFIYVFLRLGLEPYNFCTNPETAETPLEGRLGGYNLQYFFRRERKYKQGVASHLFIMKLPALQRRSDLCIPRNKLPGLVPSSYINVSVSDLYIPTTGSPILM
jgi:hypothetical protein